MKKQSISQFSSEGENGAGVNEISRTKNFKKIADVLFPKFTGINCNMLPFIIGDITSIPEKFRLYAPLIKASKPPQSLYGKVGYLTITETEVYIGITQRKKGIHLDFGKGGFISPKNEGEGIYIANNIEKSCMVWDTLISGSDSSKDGSCEHLRDSLGSGKFLNPNTLYLIHENCPHESLPMVHNTKRQFFRLVIGEIQEWYEEHSTINELGIKPGSSCKIIPVIDLNDGCHGACW